MAGGWYSGVIVAPPVAAGWGAGVYADNFGNMYLQLYYGTPGVSGSAGYTTDLDAFLTGASISASFGEGFVRYNLGGNATSVAVGAGTPGVGATYGFGPYNANDLPSWLRDKLPPPPGPGPNGPGDPSNPGGPFGPGNPAPPGDPNDPNPPGDPNNPGHTPPPGLPGAPPTPSDPLVLDLTGAGVDLSGLAGSTAYFDFTGSGFARHTGWIKPGDGLLVVNPPSGSTITSAELLGAESGNGFQDLAALDANGDGIIDASDPGFASLRVWVDADVNGQGTSGELYTLADLGITSINLTLSQSGQLINGNTVVETASFTVNTASGPVEQTIAEVNFATDPMQTIYQPPEGFTYAAEARLLPQLDGYGSMPDLWIAMSLNSALLNDVKDLILDSGTLPGAAFDAAFQSIVEEWAGASSIDPSSKGPYVNAQHLTVVYAFYGIDPLEQPRYANDPNAFAGARYESIYGAIVDELKARFVSQVPMALLLNAPDLETFASSPFLPFMRIAFNWETDRLNVDFDGLIATLSAVAPTDGTQAAAYWDQVLPIVKAMRVDLFDANSVEMASQFILAAEKSGIAEGIETAFLDMLSITHVHEGAVTGTISSLPSNAIIYLGEGDKSVSGGSNNTFVYSPDGGNDTIQTSGSSRLVMRDIDSGDLTFQRPGHGNDLIIVNNVTGKIVTITNYFTGAPLSSILLADDGVALSTGGVGDALRVQAADYLISPAYASDTSEQRVAQLSLYGFISIIDGGGSPGNLSGTVADDVMLGTAGADILHAGEGNDILLGGAGNDRLGGGWGGDTYVFNLGDGQDVIADDGYSGNDILAFGAGITAADLVVTATNNGNDMVIAIAGTTDQITIQGGINSSGYKIEQVRFADGSTLSYAQLFEMTVVPTAGNDTFYGDERGNALSGGAGNDTLYGRDGDDTLTGGTGNDRLGGGWGGDTYVFNLGDGQDVIADDGYSGSDVLAFGAGITAADLVVTATNNGNDMVIAIAGTTDQITIQGGINSGGYKIEQVRFADGSTLSYAQLFEMTVVPTAGNDTFYGDERGNALSGGAGNDTLYGRDGDDILTGGTGNDRLGGGWGGDTYVFNLGDGQDVIADDGYSGNDILAFGAGITAADLVVTATNNGNDMVIAIAGTTDQITIQGGINASGYKIEQVQFADGSTLSFADLLVRASGATAGNDTLYGDERGNTLSGGAGDDTLYGRDGDDTLTGGTGNDRLVGGWGGDTYVFNLGDGQDVFADDGYSGSDVLAFGAGITAADLVVTATNNGNDMVIAIAGTTDQITIQGGINSGGYKIEQVRFADGSTLSYAQLFEMTVVPTAGNDTFYGDERGNALLGGAGNDTLYGRDGDDTLTGGTGNDRLGGGWGGDTYVFNLGDGQDVIADDGYSGNDILAFGAGITAADLVVTATNNGNDMVIAIAGTTDQITIQGGINASGYKIEQVRFADGSTLSYAQLFEMTVVPTAGNDTFYGDERGNTLSGGAGDDTLYGRDGDDTLTGGTGNDRLGGGWGGDTYVFNLGDGQDVIADDGYSGNDILAFGAGITAADLVVTATNNGNDMVIAIAGTTDQITIQGGINSGGYKIEQVRFADGSTLSYAQLFEMTVVPTAGNDTFYGDERGNALLGGAGNDTLYGRDGDDTLTGGTGNDRLVGDWGNDTYVYARGDGNDVIDDQLGANKLILQGSATSELSVVRNGNDIILAFGTGGVDGRITLRGQLNSSGKITTVQFDDGTVWTDQTISGLAVANDGTVLTHVGTDGADTINGTSDIDVMDGGAGADVLRGGGGSDTYRWGISSGNDTIVEDGGASDVDTIRLLGLNATDVMFGRLGNHLYITINSTGEVLKVQDHFNSTNYGVEQVRFADNTSWDRAQILAAAWFIGTSVGETIDGSSGNDTIDGRGGNDRLVGHGGADTYLFGVGSGNDTIAEGSVASDGNGDTVKLVDLNIADVEFSRSGNDLFVKIVSSGETLKVENQFNGDNGIEAVAFADGTSWDRNQIVAASWYRGGTGDDSMSSSSGSDILSGGLGNDYLRGNAGSDLYVYTSGDGNDRIDDESASTTEIDTLRFTDLNASDLTFSRVGGDLAISVIATGQVVTVNYQFYSKTANWGIEKVEFADGTSWDLATINSHAWIRGTGGNDTIGGSDWNDIFWGGLGDDRFNSGAGSDTYVYALGDGNDYINDESGSTTDVDVLRLTDLNASDLTFSRVGANLVATINANGQTVTFDEQFYSKTANWGIEKIEFADGTSWDLAAINSHAWIRGTSGNDTIGGSDWNDIFSGGLGDDRFNSGAGSDTYIYALGDGNDYINDESGSTADVDVLRLTDLNASDLTLSRVGVNVVATVNANGQTITFDEQFYSQTANWGVEKIEFANGTSWDLAQINASAWIRGTAGNDTLNGTAWNDTLLGNAGNDILIGGAGSDKFVFGAGFGQDRITDFTAGTDKIEFHDGLFADASAALAAATQSGSDTLITIDATTSILLQNVAVANLHADDFRVV